MSPGLKRSQTSFILSLIININKNNTSDVENHLIWTFFNFFNFLCLKMDDNLVSEAPWWLVAPFIQASMLADET